MQGHYQTTVWQACWKYLGSWNRCPSWGRSAWTSHRASLLGMTRRPHNHSWVTERKCAGYKKCLLSCQKRQIFTLTQWCQEYACILKESIECKHNFKASDWLHKPCNYTEKKEDTNQESGYVAVNKNSVQSLLQQLHHNFQNILLDKRKLQKKTKMFAFVHAAARITVYFHDDTKFLKVL